MSLHGKNIIGNSLSAEGTQSFQAINPATGEQLDTLFHNATPAEVDAAVELAEGAFRNRQTVDPPRRASLLRRIADEIEALGDELIDRAVAETGLPEGRFVGERGRTCGQLRLFADVADEGSWVDARIDRPLPERQPIPKPDLRRMLVPVGPVVVFPASNFPLAFSVAGGDTASALAAGCPVIVKARPVHPGTSELVARAVQKAMVATDVPEGWFSMLYGPGRDVGMRLVQHPGVRAVGFTGSLYGGRALFDAAAARPAPIPVYAEMGSINPVFLLPGALSERAEQIAAGLHQSVTLGVGQFCTNPGLIVAVGGDDLDRMIAALGQLLRETPPATMLFAAIRDSYEQGVDSLSKVAGVERLAVADQPCEAAKTQAAAALLATDADVFLQNADLSREVFGPSTLVVRCRDRAQMLEVARQVEGQLTATIHATDAEASDCGDLHEILETKAGRVLYNGMPTGVEVCASMNHGGPYPATTDGMSTSVGTAAIFRFARPLCYQNAPESCLPPELHDRNECDIWRLIDNELTKGDV